jgi:hypothetical protein
MRIATGANRVSASRSVRIALWCMGCAIVPGMAPAADAQTPTRAQQLAAAVLPLPPALRAGAGVVRLDAHGHPEEWRAARNGMVCLADEPGDSLFDVRCYHASFIPLLYRARQLAAAGIPDSSLDATLDREIHSGQLRLPDGPTAGYRMLGPVSGFDWATLTAGDAIDAWQSIHMPYRTAEQLGLPPAENGIHPYVMSSGTWWSHVMIMERALRY